MNERMNDCDKPNGDPKSRLTEMSLLTLKNYFFHNFINCSSKSLKYVSRAP